MAEGEHQISARVRNMYFVGWLLLAGGSVIMGFYPAVWPAGVALWLVGGVFVLGTRKRYRKHLQKLAEGVPQTQVNKTRLIVILAVLAGVGVSAVLSSFFPAWLGLICAGLVPF